MIAAHAIRLGIDVLKPVAEHSRYDLVFSLPERMLRVQCKWAPLDNGTVCVRAYSSRRGPEGIRNRRYVADEIDALAAYCADLDRCFLVPIEAIRGRRVLHLRVTPTRNKQMGAVNIADEYDLGAVAQLGRALRWQRRGRGFESHQLHSPLKPASPEPLTLGAHEFRERFGHWMDCAAGGQEILITRHRKPFARLGPPL